MATTSHDLPATISLSALCTLTARDFYIIIIMRRSLWRDHWRARDWGYFEIMARIPMGRGGRLNTPRAYKSLRVFPIPYPSLTIHRQYTQRPQIPLQDPPNNDISTHLVRHFPHPSTRLKIQNPCQFPLHFSFTMWL